MVQEEFRLNEVIFADGVYQNWMYSICEGAVDIYSDYGTANAKKLATLTQGQFFGEIGLIAVMPRTATAVAAQERVVLVRIDRETFEEYLKKYPENMQPIMSSVSRRIRELTEDLAMITQELNEALSRRAGGQATFAWLAESVQKLLGKLNAKKVANHEVAILHKRQQALSGEGSPVIRFAAGDVIFRAGEVADCMYEVCDGTVGIYSNYQTANAKLLAKRHTDEVFGEMGVLDDMPRSATAVCLTDCAVLVVRAEQFMEFFQEKPAKVLLIMQQMCMQLRDLTKIYLQVCETLAQLPVAEEKESREEEVWARLEHIRQSQLGTSVYDVSACADWFYEHE